MSADSQDVMTEFSDRLADSGARPYFFVGSGLSARYASLPNWRGLVAELAKESGREFDYENALFAGDLPAVASSCSSRLFEEWFSARYSDFRKENKFEITNVGSPAKIWLAEWIKTHQKVNENSYRDEIEAFKKIRFGGIYTTNYDTFLENTLVLDEVVGREGLLSGAAEGARVVHKIHGSISDPNSMILTSEDYADLKLNQAYMAARLLAAFGEHPVIFVGYSLADEYIVELLGELFRLAGDDVSRRIARRLFFVQWVPNLKKPEMEASFVVRGKHVIPLTLIRTDSFEWVWEALAERGSGAPDQISSDVEDEVRRILKAQEDGSSCDGLSVVSLDLGDDAPKHLILGLGNFDERFLTKAQELSSEDVSVNDLVRDVLGVKGNRVDGKSVLTYWIPQFIRPRSDAYIPVWKYISEAGDDFELDNIVQTLATRSLIIYSHWEHYRSKAFPNGINDPTELLESSVANSNKLQWLILGVTDSSLEPDSVVKALGPHFEELAKSNPTDMRKLAVAIDRAKYNRCNFMVEKRTVLGDFAAGGES